MSNRSGFNVGDRVEHKTAIGTVKTVIDWYENDEGDMFDEDERPGDGEEYIYTECMVDWDNGKSGYYDAAELTRVDEVASFIPEDWS